MDRFSIILKKPVPQKIEDPWFCRICGNHFSSASYGGPGICPRCDCGNPPDGWTKERFYRAMMKAGHHE